MQSRLEKRLNVLRQKRETIEQELQKLESEKAQELRKIRDKKARLIGLAVLEQLDQVQPIHFANIDALAVFMNERLLRKADRVLFGFEDISADNAGTEIKSALVTTPKRKTPDKTIVTPSPPSAGHSEKHRDSTAKQARLRKTSRAAKIPLREDSTGDLLGEFNL
jgi:hypothetical protein